MCDCKNKCYNLPSIQACGGSYSVTSATLADDVVTARFTKANGTVKYLTATADEDGLVTFTVADQDKAFFNSAGTIKLKLLVLSVEQAIWGPSLLKCAAFEFSGSASGGAVTIPTT